MNEYPLYPELPDAGKEEAQALIDGFKKKLMDAAHVKQIYKDFRADIINDLNQDMVDEIQALKTQLEIERNFNRER